MIFRNTLAVHSILLMLSATGCDNSSGPEMMASTDIDGDGIPNAMDPNPNGSLQNLLNGTFTGGFASAVQITALDHNGMEDRTLVYQSDLTQDCSATWHPQGALCDEPPTTHSKTVSSKAKEQSGATWRAVDGTGGATTGILVMDACKAASSCTAIDFNEARIFQMFSDGKTTSIRLAVHPEKGATPPAATDAGWQIVGGGFTSVGAGSYSITGNINSVTNPLVIPISPAQVSRYVRVEAKNDGSLGSANYIELRSLKLFGAPPP